jgi:hypothetical protein
MKKTIIILALVVLYTNISFATTQWPSGISADIKFESSAFVLETANRNPSASAIDLNINGAYGEKNKSYDSLKKGEWFIDYQKVGMDAIIAGIYKNNQEAIQRGLKILKWGFDQEQPDGSYTTNDSYHTVAYFLATASRAVLHLENSSYKSSYMKEIAALKISIDRTVTWLTNKEIEEVGLKKDAPYTHRYYMNAVAIGFSGILLNRKDLIHRSQDLINQGLQKQNKDGANPEKEGTDTSYHSLGLFFAAQYYSVVADAEMRKKLVVMGTNGSNWLASKILPNGDVDSSLNTRTGNNGERRHGTELKTVTYFMIYKSLAYWGQVLENPELILKAKKVFEFNKSMKK